MKMEPVVAVMYVFVCPLMGHVDCLLRFRLIVFCSRNMLSNRLIVAWRNWAWTISIFYMFTGEHIQYTWLIHPSCWFSIKNW
jgi:hypothetical protein